VQKAHKQLTKKLTKISMGKVQCVNQQISQWWCLVVQHFSSAQVKN